MTQETTMNAGRTLRSVAERLGEVYRYLKDDPTAPAPNPNEFAQLRSQVNEARSDIARATLILDQVSHACLPSAQALALLVDPIEREQESLIAARDAIAQLPASARGETLDAAYRLVCSLILTDDEGRDLVDRHRDRVGLMVLTDDEVRELVDQQQYNAPDTNQ